MITHPYTTHTLPYPNVTRLNLGDNGVTYLKLWRLVDLHQEGLLLSLTASRNAHLPTALDRPIPQRVLGSHQARVGLWERSEKRSVR